MFSEIVSVIWQAVIGLLLLIDGIVYDLVCGFYKIFLFLAELDIFDNADYYNIVKRIYIILGVIMLFVLSYSLLRAVINPDNFSKGENSFGNIIKNVLISLIIIALLPTVFEVANRVQNVILNSDFIGKLILSENFTTGTLADGGRKMGSTVFQAFLRVDDNIANADIEQDKNLVIAAWQDAFNKVENGQSFKLFAMNFDYNGEIIYFPELIAKNAIAYTMIISTLAGAFLLWTIMLFCFDLGIRVIKLIYYQLIAPIAVVCRVLPGKKAKPVFDNWLKYTLSTYAEVFIRIIIMYLGIYLITLIRDRMGNIFSAASDSGLNGFQQALVVSFLVMGVVAFIKQAPKLIQNVFGIETGGMSLGIKGLFERIGVGGTLAVGALIGGAIGGSRQRLRDARAAGRSGWRAGLSAVAGGIGGGRRAFMNNLNSKSAADFRKNTSEGINATLQKGRKNDQDRTQFGSVFKARQNAVKEFLGVGENYERLQKQQKLYNDANALSSLKDIVADDAMVMAAAKEKDEIAKRDLSQYVADLQSAHYQVITRNGKNYVAQIRNGAAHIVTDSNGHTYGSLEAMARAKRIEDVEKADTILKSAQQLAIKEKYDKGDGRVIAALNKTNRLIAENRGDPNMDQLGNQIEVLTNAQAQALRAAINSDDVNTMKSFLSSMESSPGTLLHADKSMKAASGAVTAKMAKLHETQSGS